MRLWLIRHADAEWRIGTADFLRPLSAHGEQDGARMAGWLGRQDHPASWIWTSDAVRARGTARFVAAGFMAAEPVVVDEHRLYDGPPERLLDVVRETPADVLAAAVVAHNPGVSALLNLLVGDQVANDLPTFGVARITVPAPWPQLAFGRGRLELLTSPGRISLD